MEQDPTITVPLSSNRTFLCKTLHSSTVLPCEATKVFKCNIRDDVELQEQDSEKRVTSVDKFIRCQETGCTVLVQKIGNLREHLSDMHKLEFNLVDLEFPNYKAFLGWKKQVESSNCVCFVKKKTKNLPLEKHGFFYCHKSTSCRTQTSKGVNCTAQLVVKENIRNNRVSVTGCLTHYGHSMTSKHFFEGISRRTRTKTSDVAGQDTDLTQLSDELIAIYDLATTKKKQKSVERIRAALRDLFECLKDYDEDDETLPGLEETRAWKRSEALEKAQQKFDVNQT